VTQLAVLVRATLGLYQRALVDSFALTVRHAWIVLLVPLYTILLGLVEVAAAPLGFLGGFLMYLAVAACLSSFLTVIGEAVAHQRVRFAELGQTFGRYLGSIITIVFIFWIIHLLLGLIVSENPGMLWLAVAVNTGIFVVFNAVPELIYQGQRDGLALLEDAVQFLRDNTVEWLFPLAVMLAPLFATDLREGFVAMANLGATTVLFWTRNAIAEWLPGSGDLQNLLATALASAAIVWIMLFRGLLFRSLWRSGRRQRVFEARMRGGV
jgi:hypothetical protein